MDAKRVADMAPSELRAMIQGGVMTGMLGVFALFGVLGTALYIWLH